MASEGTNNPPVEEEIADSFLTGGGNSANQQNLQANNQSFTQISSEEGTDPITEAIRREILERQRALLRTYIGDKHPELADQIAKDEQDKQDLKFREFLAKAENEELVKEALKANKPALENLEITGYRTVLSNPDHNFSTMKWDTTPSVASAGDIRAQVVRNDLGEEICTIQETAKNVPIQIQKEDGTNVTIAKHRIVDFPIKLEGADGRMHFAMNAYDDNGKPSREATFTAHYEEPIGGGKPLLKEISHPVPIKFTSNEPDAVAYVERAGKIYTLPVTREKYEAMQKEVMQNLGQEQEVARGQAQQQNVGIEPQTQDRGVGSQNQAYPNMGPAGGPTVPSANQSTSTGPVQQPAGPNPALNLDDLLKQLDDNLQNGLNVQAIKNTVDTALNDPDSSIDDKKNGVTVVTETILNHEKLTQPEKIEGIGVIAKTVVENPNIPEPDKADMLVNIADTVLKNNNLDADGKDKAVQAVVDQALALSPEGVKKALDGITDSITQSDLNPEEKGKILEKMVDKILADSMDNGLKEELIKSILDKGVQAAAFNEEQKRKIEENIDKLKPEEVQKAKQTLADSGVNTEDKRQSIKELTKEVLESEKSTADKSKIIGGITQEVASSTLSLDDKKDIVQDTATLVADSDKVDLEGKKQIVAAMSQGVAESTASVDDKKELVKSIGEGISQSQAQDIEKSGMVEAISIGINNSSSEPNLKDQLNAAAQEVADALAKLVEATKGPATGMEEASTLDKFNNLPDQKAQEEFLRKALDGKDTKDQKAELLNELVVNNPDLDNKGKEDLVKAVLVDQSVENNAVLRDALDKVVLNQGPSTPEPESKQVPSEDRTKQQTVEPKETEGQKEQQDIKNQQVIDMADRIKDRLSASGNFDRPDFTKQKEGIVNQYAQKQTVEEKKAFIDSFGKDNKLSKSQEIAVIESMLQKEAEGRGKDKQNLNPATVDVQVEKGPVQQDPKTGIELAKAEKETQPIGVKGGNVKERVENYDKVQIMQILNAKKAELNKPVIKQSQKSGPGLG